MDKLLSNARNGRMVDFGVAFIVHKQLLNPKRKADNGKSS